jgi:hypothetical protein
MVKDQNHSGYSTVLNQQHPKTTIVWCNGCGMLRSVAEFEGDSKFGDKECCKVVTKEHNKQPTWSRYSKNLRSLIDKEK